MKTFTLSNAKAKLSELIDEVRTSGEPVSICRHKKEVAVLIDAEVFRKMLILEDRMKIEQLREALKGERRPLRKVLEELDLGI